MNVYVFEEVSELTNNYHNNGGLVVVAKDRNRVLDLIEAHHEPIAVTDEEWSEVAIYPTTEDVKERVYIFPDAGCC